MPTPSASSLAVFAPVFVLAGWTLAILIRIAITRISAALKGQVSPGDFRLGESADVPDTVRLANRNYMNLLELPVLFYAIVIMAFVTGTASPVVVGLAWVYTGLRIVHSLIHLTYNHVIHRLIVFAASNFVLTTIWIVVGSGLLA